MRGYLSCFVAAVTALSAQGCANYPLPQDITGSNTADIVARVRCEARDAIRSAAIKEISAYKDDIIYNNMKGPEFAAWLEEMPVRFNEIGAVKLKNKVINKAFEYFRQAQITYEFTLNLNESNIQGVNFDLVRTFARRVDTLGVGAKGERTRQTIRRFEVTDNFLVLATKAPGDYCAIARSIDLVYPIEGKLKIYDLVDSFIFINKNGSFEGTPTGPAIKKMADTIIFSTKFLGSVSPTFALNPTQMYGFELSKFAVTNDNFREDSHQVIVTTTLPGLKDFPYYAGKDPLSFKDGDPRLQIARNSIQETRRDNLFDAITGLANRSARLPYP